jgi:hypothetical protein
MYNIRYNNMIWSHHVDHSAILQAQPHLWSLNICFTLAPQHSNQQHNLKPYPFLATRRMLKKTKLCNNLVWIVDRKYVKTR